MKKKCLVCASEFTPKSNRQLYCSVCRIFVRRIRQKHYISKKRSGKKRALSDDAFSVDNQAYLDESKICRYAVYIPNYCSECSNTTFDIDYIHAEVVCRECGFVVNDIINYL